MSGGRRNNGSSEKQNTGGWMITFSDLIMLMLTFFVLLLTMSSLNQKSMKELFSHLQESTGVLEFSGYGEIQSFASVVKKYNDSETRIVINQNNYAHLLMPAIESTKEIRDKIENLNQLVDIIDDERGIIVSFQEKILFEAGGVEIKKSSYAFLDTLARVIATCPNDILVMGHTDSLPYQGSDYESNWELSVYRGLAVLNYFLKVKQLTPERFFVGGYGSSRPLSTNESPEDRAMNRRVEVIFKHLGEI